MDRSTFSKLSDDCLARVAKFCEPFDPDELDFATTDGVVTLEFPDRVRYVLNRQAATNQMWFAAGARAWHFDYDAAKKTWVGDRDGLDLFVCIGEVVSAKLGRKVAL
ncbi:MAG: iron donor protein CyaY [Planctomycetota bacterium]|nr:iron donor protein CyaY [Planctomycetota bacterium]